MNITNKFITLLACVGFSITACVGSDSDGGIKQPSNLVSDTGAISTSGANNTVTIKNIGQLPIIINNTTVSMEDTTDRISDASGCNNKTLSASQTCQIKLTTYSGEAGITTLHVATNNGIYDFPINVDTSGEGVIDTDTKVLDTTKEKIVNILNKGALPIKLTSLTLETENKTLTITDSNCLNNIINAGSTCQIKAKATPNHNIVHTLSVTTSNKYLKIQNLKLDEHTDTSALQLTKNDTHITSTINIKEPGVSSYTIKNNGSNDINITTINALENNIGKITNNQCDGILLQSDDTCTFDMQVNRNAYGTGNLTVNTKETLANPISYLVNIDSPNLTVEDGNSNSNDIAVHTNSHKEVKIINTGLFDIDVNNVEFNSKEVKLLNTCNGIITSGGECKISLDALNNEDDNGTIIFDEFDSKLIQKINLHINDGISVIAEDNNSKYVNILPKDDNFYQVFILDNPTDKVQSPTITLPSSIIQPINVSDIDSSLFLLPSCIDEKHILTINPMTKCELVIRESNDWNKLQDLTKDITPSNKNTLSIQIQYKDSKDMFTQKYQVYVNHHNQSASYNPGDNVLADQHIDHNDCGIASSNATIVQNITDTGQGTHGPYPILKSTGVVLFGSLLNTNTISATVFRTDGGACFLNSTNAPVTLLPIYTTDTEILRVADADTYYILKVSSGSYCSFTVGGLCSLSTTMHLVSIRYGGDYIIASRFLNFRAPIPALTIADSVVWNNIGSMVTHGTNQ